MKISSTSKFLLTALSALAVSLASLSSLSADVIFYTDGAYYNGADGFANGSYDADSSTILYGGLNTMEVTYTGNYQSGGVDFYGGNETIPLGITNLEFAFYVDVVGLWYMNGFTLNMDTGSFNTGTDTWTLDGSPGATGNLSGGAWHTISVDLTSVTGFVAGTSEMSGLIAIKNNTTTPNVYIGDIRLTTVPEPSALALVGLGLFGLVARRRR